MKLPNGSAAFVDLAKLRDYSLSETHPEGKHKARVFQAALGITSYDAEWLRDELLSAAVRETCRAELQTRHGRRYSVSFTVRKNDLEARLRSAWIIRPDEEFPRLVSCYVV